MSQKVFVECTGENTVGNLRAEVNCSVDFLTETFATVISNIQGVDANEIIAGIAIKVRGIKNVREKDTRV